MIYAKPQEIVSLLFSVKYTHTKNTEYDFSKQPRPCHNFVFMLEGEGVILSNNENIRLKAGDILFIPKNTTYKSTWIPMPKAVFHSLHFSFQAKNDPLFNKIIPVQLLDNTQFERLYALLKEIELHQFSKNTQSFFTISAFYELCGRLFERVKINTPKTISKTISPAIAYVEQNYTKPISVETLANLCFLSPSRFYYLFKQQTGISPIVYKNIVAIQNVAQELIYNKEEPIKNIAERHGFPSIVYFERLFKKTTGKTPSQYRKEESLL